MTTQLSAPSKGSLATAEMPCAKAGMIPWCQLLGAGVWCQNVTELCELLDQSLPVVLDSIEALTCVQTDALGEMFRLREMSNA